MSREFADWSEAAPAVYPGITGLWQVNGRSELPFEEMVRLDLQYIREWSLLLDIKIILATPGLVVRGVRSLLIPVQIACQQTPAVIRILV